MARPLCKFGSEPLLAVLLVAPSAELGASLSAWQRLPPSCTPKLVTAERKAFIAQGLTEGRSAGSSLWGGAEGVSRGGGEEVGCIRGNCRAAVGGPENWLK